MSTKTDISDTRRGIANNKLKPVVALNKMADSFSRILKMIPRDNIGVYVADIWSLYYEMATGHTTKYNGYGHNKQWFDAKVTEMGRLMVKLEKAIKVEAKNTKKPTKKKVAKKKPAKNIKKKS